MPMLALNGYPVPLAQSGDQSSTPEPIGGGVVRMWDGSGRRTKRDEKATDSYTTIPLLAADANTLRPLLKVLGTVTASGDLIGGSVSVFPQITNEKKVTMNGVARWVFTFTLAEA